MAWITSRWNLPVGIQSCEKLVRSPALDAVLPHLKRLEEAFDVVLSWTDEPEVLMVDLLGTCTDGKPELLIAPYGTARIEHVCKLPVVDGFGRPIPSTISRREYFGQCVTVVDTPDARYHLLH